MKSVVLVDSGGTNIGSVRAAFERLGARAELSRDPQVISSADRVLLPGVGAAGPGMKQLRDSGLATLIRSLTQPVLGICLGMQLLFEGSEEGNVTGLGLVPGQVSAFRPAAGLRVPHMGWNRLQVLRDDPLLHGLGPDPYAYFVHSYRATLSADTTAATVHGEPFSAAVQRGNIRGTQFHPERSAAVGARIFRNFLELS